MINKLLALCAVCLSVACMPLLTQHVMDVNPLNWAPEDAVVVSIENHDTSSLRNISLITRFNNTFSARTLPLSIKIITPNNKSRTEQFVIYPAQPCLNKKFIEAEQPYRLNIKLNQCGTYHFCFTHSLPFPISGVSAIGVNITANKSN